ncbi:hypothetical protein [Streptomyces sp. NPDC060022]|uniref:hypothetical protein n=1 Tax=Streptomyces sp. NPDC060022 TaxID=3347039 RepID=UPI0036D09130
MLTTLDETTLLQQAKRLGRLTDDAEERRNEVVEETDRSSLSVADPSAPYGILVTEATQLLEEFRFGVRLGPPTPPRTDTSSPSRTGRAPPCGSREPREVAVGRRPGVFVRPMGMEEGRRLQRISRTAKDPVRLRRAIVVMVPAQGQSVLDITWAASSGSSDGLEEDAHRRCSPAR